MNKRCETCKHWKEIQEPKNYGRCTLFNVPYHKNSGIRCKNWEEKTPDPWTAERVKALRESYQMSQSEFARKMRIPVATLQNWEGGRSIGGLASALLNVMAGAAQAVISNQSKL